jgi:hypothetical protein
MSKLLIVLFVFAALALSAEAQSRQDNSFIEFISTNSANGGLEKICPIKRSAAARQILSEYGAIFSSGDNVIRPPVCIFDGDAAVSDFQKKVPTGFVVIDGLPLTFQKAAADSLSAVLAEATLAGMRIRPLDGEIAAGRTYADTVRLWNSRFEPALRFWTLRGKILPADADLVRQADLDNRIEQVMAWESAGMFFGTGRAASIFSSVAPPGTSQHLSLIALDVAPPITPSLRAIMNAHGWFQTVKGDVPHFTYLGVAERDLVSRGLKAIVYKGTQYWVPNVSFDPGSTPQPN